MLSYLRSFFVIALLALPIQTFAFGTSSPVKAELIQEEETIQPGRPFWLAIHLKIEDNWHVYWKNPGDAGIPLKIDWKLPKGFEAGPLQWPFPEKFNVADMVGYGYEGNVVLLTLLSAPANLPLGQPIELQAQIEWLVCSDMNCQPGSALASVTVTPSALKPQLRSESLALFEEARTKIPKSHAEIKTLRKEGVVQIEVPQEAKKASSEKIVGVAFFPEQKDVIDHSVDPTLAHAPQGEDRYFVNLKGGDEIGARQSHLKGVLVVHTQKGAQAFDIDAPIQETEGRELLSMVDKPVSRSLQGAADTSYTFEGGLGLALAFAFLGGMILNLMPCVLPVISFKVMSFVKMAGQSRALTLRHGLFFSLGVVLSFWVLATVMLLLRDFGQAVGWGFQLQDPLFVVILASILFIFSLSLFGLFEWGLFFASWAGQTEVDQAKTSSGYTGSFLSGILATAVATPCTGPFLGSAIGFAVTLPVFQALLIFTSLGLGMCFPYLLLAGFPSLLRFLPRPGAWMEVFKELMGFLLLATVLWLLWVFSAQTNTLALICLLGGFLCFAIGAWIYGKGTAPLVSRKKRAMAYAFTLLFALGGVQAILLPKATWSQTDAAETAKQWNGWEPFSPERLAELRAQGIPVMIDFTAKWCLICQANHMVLDSKEVQGELKKAGAVKMVADWTKNDPVITQELSKFGRNSVPLYVFYGKDAGKDPVILPQVLTTGNVVEHLNQAFEAEAVALHD